MSPQSSRSRENAGLSENDGNRAENKEQWWWCQRAVVKKYDTAEVSCINEGNLLNISCDDLRYCWQNEL